MVSAPVDVSGLVLAPALALLDVLARVAWVPDRPAHPRVPPPDAQFDLTAHVPPARVVDGIRIPFGPVHTVFATAALDGTPTGADRARFADALAALEADHPWAPDGLLVHVGYGLPYFRRLPRGLSDLYLPRLLADTTRFVLEEAVPEPGARIEDDDVLLTLRADDPRHLADALVRLAGGGLRFTSARVMFAQPGLPRALAVRYRLPCAERISPRAPGWPGLLDGPPDAGTPEPVVTFRAAATTAQRGDYFDEGAVLHLAHSPVDVSGSGADDAFTERVRSVYRTGPAPTSAVPPHQRVDGSGLQARRPSYHCALLVPAAGHVAALGPPPAVQRQNFLVPPRRHRCFPLVELA